MAQDINTACGRFDLAAVAWLQNGGYVLLYRLCPSDRGLVIGGRPITYVTTPHFLRCFSMNSLDDLVPTSEIVSGFESENEMLQSDEDAETEE